MLIQGVIIPVHKARGLAIIPVIVLAAACSATVPTAVPSASAAATPSAAPSSAPTPSAAPSSAPSPTPSPTPSPSPSGSPGIAHKTGHGDLVLRIAVAGGFISPSAQLFALPEIAIYGDGTVLVRDDSGSAAPTPGVPPMLVTTISEAGLQKILAAAGDAGLLGKNGQYSGGIMPEAATTTFTVIAEGHTHTISVVALGKAGGDPSTQAIRDKLLAFETALQDVPTLVGAANVTTAQAPFQPSGIEVFVATFDNGPTPAKTLAWPLSTPLASFGQPIASSGSGGGIRGPSLNCGIVTGTDLAALLPVLATAAPDSVWNSEGSFYSLTIRPELPDEAACPGV